MSKYKVGDKFVIEIDKILENKELPFEDEKDILYRTKGFKSLVFDEFGLDKLTKLDTQTDNVSADEAWKIVQKIVLGAVSHNGFTIDELNEIFGTKSAYDIIKNNSFPEVTTKIEEWQKKKSEIKVGDVVYFSNSDTTGVVVSPRVVVSPGKDSNYVLFDDGSCGLQKTETMKKTGRKIDVQGVLSQIGE